MRQLALFVAAFALVGALASIPAVSHATLHTIYERTLAYQGDRGSPFSVWGLYGGFGGVQLAVQIAAGVLAVALALIPRQRDVVGLATCTSRGLPRSRCWRCSAVSAPPLRDARPRHQNLLDRVSPQRL
jgi:hypothetical protein